MQADGEAFSPGCMKTEFKAQRAKRVKTEKCRKQPSYYDTTQSIVVRTCFDSSKSKLQARCLKLWALNYKIRLIETNQRGNKVSLDISEKLENGQNILLTP